MKRIIFITIFVLSFCFVTLAQVDGTRISQTPKLVAQFSDSDGEWYKLTMELLSLELSKDLSATGLIRVKNDKSFQRRFLLLRKGLTFYRMDLTRITLIIVENQSNDTDVLVIQSCSEIPKCKNCIVLRAEDIDKITKLFCPKVIKNKKIKK